MNKEQMSVGYLGPEGSYTEDATISMYGEEVIRVPIGSLHSILRSTESGATSHGVLPIENTSEGPVNKTHMLLAETDLQIVQEAILPIRHNLLAKNTSEKQEISSIFAHSQAIGQCSGWLQKNMPEVPIIPVSSNSEGAKMAAKQSGVAAIASKRAAEIYDLEVVNSNINDENHNSTRFVALGKVAPEPTEQDKTSLVCRLKDNDPGALVRIIRPLAFRGINMSRIQSQPDGSTEKYLMYIDIEGHQQDENIIKAIQEMRRNAKGLKVLGSYPVSKLVQYS